MAETLIKSTTDQDAEKAQEKKRRPEPAPLPVKVLTDEAISFPGLVGVSATNPPLESHATLLGDPRFSHPANNAQRARIVTELQKTRGNTYVQRVVDNIHSAAMAAQPQTIPAIQLQEENEIDESPETQISLEAKEKSGGVSVVTPELEARIRTLSGGGRPLPDTTRSSMRQYFGHDFGRIRIHTDKEAAETARDLGARAFTIGQDVVFGQGPFGCLSSSLCALQCIAPANPEALAPPHTHGVSQVRPAQVAPGACPAPSRPIELFPAPVPYQVFGRLPDPR